MRQQKNPHKLPPDPREPRTQLLLYFAGTEADRRRHKTEERYKQYADLHDLIYDVALRDGGYRCARCGCNKNLSLDHIRPICKGGKTELGNAQLLCRACNRAKSDQIIDYRPKPEKG